MKGRKTIFLEFDFIYLKLIKITPLSSALPSFWLGSHTRTPSLQPSQVHQIHPWSLAS